MAEVLKHLLLPPSSEPAHDDRSRSRSYWDLALRHNPGEYHSFVRYLHSRGMIEFHRSCDQQVGIFFVRKKSGSLRFVGDARSTNSRFCDPALYSVSIDGRRCGVRVPD